MKRIVAWLSMRSVGSGTAVVFLLASLMAVAGSTAQWIWLPLSAPIAGGEIEWFALQTGDGAATPVTYGKALVVAFGVAAVLAWFGLRYPAFVVLLVAFAVLVYFPVRLIFIDAHWVEVYMAEAVERSGLQRFLHTFYLPPNRGGELAFVDVRNIEFLSERAAVVSYVLGWGWMLAVVGCVLMMVIVKLAGVPSYWGLLLGSLLTVVLVIAALFGVDELAAEYAHRQGDQSLGVGEYEQALDAYELALRRDPALRLSMPLAIKISKAYYQLLGENHDYSQLYLADLEHSRRRYEDAVLRLRLSQALPEGFFADYLQKMMRVKHLEVELDAGLNHFIKGNFARSRDYIRTVLGMNPRSIRGRMYMARLLYDLRDYPNCMPILKQLINEVYHPSFQADFYSGIGDALTALGKLPQAREAYQASYDLDSKDNFRAIKGLSGT